MKIKSFDNWYKAVNEEVTEPTAAIDAEATSRDAMMHDVDAIMTSLETLAGELQESLQHPDVDAIYEDETNTQALMKMGAGATALAAAAGAGAYLAVKKALDYSIRGPKAAKAQAKIGVMRLQQEKLAAALSDAKEKGSDSKKIDMIKARIEKAKEATDEYQEQLDKKYANASATVQKFIANQKLKDRLALANAQLAGTSDEDAQELKDKMKDLNQRLKDETAALKELEPSKEEKAQAEKEAKELKAKADAEAKAKAEKEAKEKAEKEGKAPAEETPEVENPTKSSETEEETPETEEETPETEEDKVAQKEAEITQINNNIEDEKNRMSDLQSQLQQTQAEQEKSTNPESFNDKIAQLKKGIEDSREDIAQLKKEEVKSKDELSKMTAKESLVYRALQLNNEILAEEIANKQDWQLENNSALYTKYNTIITKAENDSILTESLSLNIKDRFKKLI